MPARPCHVWAIADSTDGTTMVFHCFMARCLLVLPGQDIHSKGLRPVEAGLHAREVSNSAPESKKTLHPVLSTQHSVPPTAMGHLPSTSDGNLRALSRKERRPGLDPQNNSAIMPSGGCAMVEQSRAGAGCPIRIPKSEIRISPTAPRPDLFRDARRGEGINRSHAAY